MKKTLTTIRRMAVTACTCIILWGCSQEYSNIPHEEGVTPISFIIPNTQENDVWQTPSTRGTDHTPTPPKPYKKDFDNGDAIGVFADYYATENTAPRPYITDEQVTKRGEDNWKPSHLRYWPNNSDAERLKFFAYWTDPDESQVIYNNDPQNPKLLYDAPDANIDVIAAMTELLPRPADDAADKSTEILFEHLLTKVNFTFTAKCTNGETVSHYHPLVFMVRFKAPVKGTYDLRTQEWTVEQVGADGPFITRFTDVQGVPIDSENQQIDDFTCFLIPGTELKEIIFDINNKRVSCSIPQDIQVTGYGQEINLNFKIDTPEGHVFLATYSLWAEGGTIDGKLE